MLSTHAILNITESKIDDFLEEISASCRSSESIQNNKIVCYILYFLIFSKILTLSRSTDFYSSNLCRTVDS